MSRGAARIVGNVVLAAALAGCATPDKPVRAALYDFGPGTSAPAALAPSIQPTLVLADVQASASLDGSAVVYRLAYADDKQLRPYAHARWSAPPAQLLRQRLRQRLARERVVLDPSDGAALARGGGAVLRVLRVDLEEFSQVFDSPATSWGLLQLRATLTDNTPAGEKLLAQRSFLIRHAAASGDAPGGVRALAEAADAAADEIAHWLAQVR